MLYRNWGFRPFTAAANTTAIQFRYELARPGSTTWSMPVTGTSGLDLYRYDPNTSAWRWVVQSLSPFKPSMEMVMVAATGSAAAAAAARDRYAAQSVQFEVAGLGDVDPAGDTQPATYMFYLPMRNAIFQGAVGSLPPGAITPARTVFAGDGVTMHGRKPIVHYGATAVQGGTVARVGHAFTNVYGRNLGRVVLNFGFAAGEDSDGSGEKTIRHAAESESESESESEFFDLATARCLAAVDAAAVVIERNTGLSPAQISAGIPAFVGALRAKGNSSTPIVLSAGPNRATRWFAPAGDDARRAALNAAFTALVAVGDAALQLVENANDELVSGAGDYDAADVTVDATHPSDLGHRAIANFWSNFFKELP